MVQIKDLVVGNTVDCYFVIQENSVRIASNKKPFLSVTLSDGLSTINGKKWDFYEKAFLPNQVVAIKATVSTYQGKIQLDISSIELAVDQDISKFIPDNGIDTDAEYMFMLSCFNSIENAELKTLCFNIFAALKQRITYLPAAKGFHHAYKGGWLEHSAGTVRNARAIASVYGDTVSMDLVTAGAGLHDIGKLFVYKMDGPAIDYTTEGVMFDHVVAGIMMIESWRDEYNSDIVDLLIHIIASHHGKLELGSPIEPKFLEAHIVAKADGIDALFNQIIDLNKELPTPDSDVTAKCYSFGNHPIISQAHVNKIMHRDTRKVHTCAACDATVIIDEDMLVCPKCGTEYPVENNNIPPFIE